MSYETPRRMTIYGTGSHYDGSYHDGIRFERIWRRSPKFGQYVKLEVSRIGKELT